MHASKCDLLGADLLELGFSELFRSSEIIIFYRFFSRKQMLKDSHNHSIVQTESNVIHYQKKNIYSYDFDVTLLFDMTYP